MRNKISVIGAGNVGASCALWLAQSNVADLVLVDIPQTETMPVGKALDLLQAGPIMGYDAHITGTAGGSYDGTENSDIVIITAGIARKPGMSRDDLLATNKKIMTSVTEQVAKYSPNAILIVVSNPLDAMCHVAMTSAASRKTA